MDDKLTEIVCIVDKSGSMHRVKEDAIGGFNQFLDEQERLEGPAALTLTLFNHEIDVVWKSEPLEEVDRLDEETFRPGGMTALMDAVGQTLETLGGKFRRRDDSPDHVIVLILTDGRENASRGYRREEIADMIDRREERRDWEFVFWGADIDAAQVASRLHIDQDNVSQVDANGEGLQKAFGEMSRLTQDFRESGSFSERLKELEESTDDGGDDQ